jgi:hypothetical protein
MLTATCTYPGEERREERRGERREEERGCVCKRKKEKESERKKERVKNKISINSVHTERSAAKFIAAPYVVGPSASYARSGSNVDRSGSVHFSAKGWQPSGVGLLLPRLVILSRTSHASFTNMSSAPDRPLCPAVPPHLENRGGGRDNKREREREIRTDPEMVRERGEGKIH